MLIPLKFEMCTCWLTSHPACMRRDITFVYLKTIAAIMVLFYVNL